MAPLQEKVRAVEAEDKLQRAIALIQLLINSTGEDFFEVEEEARAQLKEWGIKVPDHEGRL